MLKTVVMINMFVETTLSIYQAWWKESSKESHSFEIKLFIFNKLLISMVWYWISNVRTKKSTLYEAYYGEGLSREY